MAKIQKRRKRGGTFLGESKTTTTEGRDCLEVHRPSPHPGLKESRGMKGSDPCESYHIVEKKKRTGSYNQREK